MKKIKLLFLFLLLLVTIGVLFYYAPSPNTSNETPLKLNYNKEIVHNEVINNQTKEIVSEEQSNDKNVIKSQLILYSANWCGICQKIKPNWENAKNLIQIKYPNIEVININCDNPRQNKCFSYINGKQQSLDGVPTILLRRNKIDIEYKKDTKNNFKGDRSVDELLRFVELNK
jgi:thiol-disulfide isomerase/thioredoxin